jgi:hypothetical protein
MWGDNWCAHSGMSVPGSRALLPVAGKKARLSDSGVREMVARQPLGAALTY